MTIQEALATPGPLVALWDDSRTADAWLGIYKLGPNLKLLACELMSAEQRPPRTAELRERGVRIGATTGTSPCSWSDDGSFIIWSEQVVGIEASRTEIRCADGRRVGAGEVVRVVSFIDADARGHRGVRLDLVDGTHVIIVEERDQVAELDPTYGWDNVAIDALWVSLLGQRLATWLAVPHHDELP